MPLKACTSCGRVTSKCPACLAAGGAPKRRGSTRAYRKTRAEVLERDGSRCFYCASTDRIQADHIIAEIHGGSDDASNLRAACMRCNLAKSDDALRPRPTVAVLGEIAAGKSTFVTQLAELTEWRTTSIDEHYARGGDWDSLVDELSRVNAPVIVESLALPRSYRRQLVLSCAVFVVVACDEGERQARIAARGRGQPTDLRHPDQSAHFHVDGSRPASPAVLQRVADAARRRGGSESRRAL